MLQARNGENKKIVKDISQIDQGDQNTDLQTVQDQPLQPPKVTPRSQTDNDIHKDITDGESDSEKEDNADIEIPLVKRRKLVDALDPVRDVSITTKEGTGGSVLEDGVAEIIPMAKPKSLGNAANSSSESNDSTDGSIALGTSSFPRTVVSPHFQIDMSGNPEVEATNHEPLPSTQHQRIVLDSSLTNEDSISSNSLCTRSNSATRRVSFNDNPDIIDDSRRTVSFSNDIDVVDPSRTIVQFTVNPAEIIPDVSVEPELEAQSEVTMIDNTQRENNFENNQTVIITEQEPELIDLAGEEEEETNKNILVISSDEESNEEEEEDDYKVEGSNDENLEITKTRRLSIKEQLENNKPMNISKLSSAQCAICFDSPEVSVFLPCGHIFCNHCAFRSLSTTKQSNKSGGPCPLCRNSTPYKKVIRGIFKKKKKFLGTQGHL